jgi:hypothetical protein
MIVSFHPNANDFAALTGHGQPPGYLDCSRGNLPGFSHQFEAHCNLAAVTIFPIPNCQLTTTVEVETLDHTVFGFKRQQSIAEISRIFSREILPPK